MDSGACDPAHPPFDAQAPITVDVLADLQAGLLDDATAAHVRHRVRNDVHLTRQLAALDRVRGELATLGADAPSAPDVPATVTTRVTEALRTAPAVAPGHAARPFRIRPQTVVAWLGALAAVAAAVIGTVTLLRPVTPSRAPDPTAEKLTARPSTGFPLSATQLADLVHRPADLGPLADPQRRSSCLGGLGYPAATQVLGATQLRAGGQSFVVLLVPGPTPRVVNALVVRPNCSSADTGLLADTTVRQP